MYYSIAGVDHLYRFLRNEKTKLGITEDRFLRKGRFSVNSTHHQAVKELGTGLKAFAFSIDNFVGAFYYEDLPFLVGFQWHNAV